jgi:hypothetical protein
MLIFNQLKFSPVMAGVVAAEVFGASAAKSAKNRQVDIPKNFQFFLIQKIQCTLKTAETRYCIVFQLCNKLLFIWNLLQKNTGCYKKCCNKL